MARTPEGNVKHKIKEYLKTIPGLWFYMPMQNGMGEQGIPDFIGCYEGRFFAIEAKAPGKLKTLTPNQLRIQTLILAAGGVHVVADSFEMALTKAVEQGFKPGLKDQK